jgi:hypothetical protein
VKGYGQDPTRYLHFEKYTKKCGDFVLIEAGFTKPDYWKEYNFTSAELEEVLSKKVVLLEFEEPNKLFVGDYPQPYDKYFYRIFTLCPYTAEWLNKKYKTKKRVPIFFPIHERYTPPRRKKTIDVIYSGHILSKELRRELEQLRSFNYCIISNSKDPLVTHPSVPYAKKMELYSRSKITLVQNLIYRTYLPRIVSVWLSGDFWNNRAFAQFPVPWKPWELFTKNMHVPQLKSRAFEAAVSRSLILCRKDEFNIIERYFEPGKEFIYYESGELEDRIRHILSHYSDYADIINRAYNRATKEYTVKAFVKKYLMNL